MKWVWNEDKRIAVNLDQTANIEIQERDHDCVVVACQKSFSPIVLKRGLNLGDAYDFVNGITGAVNGGTL